MLSELIKNREKKFTCFIFSNGVVNAGEPIIVLMIHPGSGL
jgi:hypothetical protein